MINWKPTGVTWTGKYRLCVWVGGKWSGGKWENFPLPTPITRCGCGCGYTCPGNQKPRTQAKPCGQVKKRALNSPVSTTTTTRCCAGLPNTRTHSHTDKQGVLNGSPAFLLLFCLYCPLARTHTFQAAAPITECCTRLENGACVCSASVCVWAQVATSRLPASILPFKVQ